jgi:hypothetical protein
MEVDLDIHKNVICIEVDLASDDERKIWASFLQITCLYRPPRTPSGEISHVSSN